MFDFSTKARRKEAGDFLDTAWKGLDYLCQQVEAAERERAKSLGKNFGYVDFGSHPDDWLACNYFLWYANALSNFIGVFKKAFRPRENLSKKFRSVITWRNKVAAHTSWVWPKGDNAATQNMSILLFPEFNLQGDGHFEVGGFRVFSHRTEPLLVRAKKFLRKVCYRLVGRKEPPCRNQTSVRAPHTPLVHRIFESFFRHRMSKTRPPPRKTASKGVNQFGHVKTLKSSESTQIFCKLTRDSAVGKCLFLAYFGLFRLTNEMTQIFREGRMRFKMECARRGSNPQPLAPEANALSS